MNSWKALAFFRYWATERSMNESDHGLRETSSQVTSGRRTTKAMEAVLLETPFLGDGLVYGVACDVRGNRAMEGSVKECDRIRFRKH